MPDGAQGPKECPRGFPCLKSDLTHVGEVIILANGEVLECRDENAATCPFAMSFGDGRFCLCQQRKLVAQTLGA